MRAEIDSFLVWWSIDLVFVWVVEINLVFRCGPQIAWFNVSIEIDLDFVRVVEIDFISVRGVDPL